MIEVSKIAHFAGHKDSIYALTCRYGQKNFYSAGADGMIVEWNIDEPGDGLLKAKTASPAWSLRLIGQYLFAGTRNGEIYKINLIEGINEAQLLAHQGGIFDIQYFNGYLYTAGQDGYICRYTQKLELTAKTQISIKSLRAIRFTGNLLLAAASDGQVYSLDAESMQIIKTYSGHTNSVFSLGYRHNLPYFFSGGRDAMIIQHGFNNELVKQVPAHLYHVHYLDVHPVFPLMLSCSMDKTIKLWSTDDLKLLKVINFEKHQAHLNSVNKVLWIDSNRFISCSDDRTVMAFEANLSHFQTDT